MERQGEAALLHLTLCLAGGEERRGYRTEVKETKLKIEWSSREVHSFNRSRGMFKWDRKREQGCRDVETEEVKRGQRVKREIKQYYQKSIQS